MYDMKKTWANRKKRSAVLFLLIILFGISAAEAAEQEPVFTTMAQAMDESISTGLYGWSQNCYVVIVNIADRYIRVVAQADPETIQRRDELYQSEDFEDMFARLDELSAALPVSYTEDLTEAILSQDELNAFVGWTVKDLTDKGWELSSHGYGGPLDEVSFTMSRDLFDYEFAMNESADLYMERSYEEAFEDFSVKSVSFAGISYHAIDLQYQADGTFIPSVPDDDSFYVLKALLNHALSALEDVGGMDRGSIISHLIETLSESDENRLSE